MSFSKRRSSSKQRPGSVEIPKRFLAASRRAKFLYTKLCVLRLMSSGDAGIGIPGNLEALTWRGLLCLLDEFYEKPR